MRLFKVDVFSLNTLRYGINVRLSLNAACSKALGKLRKIFCTIKMFPEIFLAKHRRVRRQLQAIQTSMLLIVVFLNEGKIFVCCNSNINKSAHLLYQILSRPLFWWVPLNSATHQSTELVQFSPNFFFYEWNMPFLNKRMKWWYIFRHKIGQICGDPNENQNTFETNHMIHETGV